MGKRIHGKHDCKVGELMTFMDICAGIGGFRAGMEQAGHKCIGFCERDKFAVASYTAMYCVNEKQLEYLKTLPLKQRQKEILKEEYRNDEYYADDIERLGNSPRADIWCFGFPCQDISVAGRRSGLAGARSGLFYSIIAKIKSKKEEDKPKILFIENVKNLLSINDGWDFADILTELDEAGYDVEWQVLNSKHFGVPQNRERIFIIGHLRGRSGGKVFPIRGTGGENIKTINNVSNNFNRTPLPNLSRTLKAHKHDAGVVFCDLTYGTGLNATNNARCLQARYNKGISRNRGEISGVAIPVLTPDKENKRQNGRRIKENGEPMFTLTSQDRHGVMTGDYMIRRLTPKECFRLQGFPDEMFEKAALVNSDTQLYKQAGNAVTVNVIKAISERF